MQVRAAFWRKSTGLWEYLEVKVEGEGTVAGPRFLA